MQSSRNRTLVLASILALSISVACGGDEDAPEIVAQATICPQDSTLTYENFGEPFMRNWCTGCHSSDLPIGTRQNAPGGYDFDTREGVLEWIHRINVRAVELGTMPPTSGPSVEEREMLGEWIACGAPSEAQLSEGGE